MKSAIALCCAAVLAACLLGCQPSQPPFIISGEGEKSVPKPLNLLLPKSIRPLAYRTFVEGLSRGLEVQVQAFDSFEDDATKAFGEFRFELYEWRSQNPDPKGKMLNIWRVGLMDGPTNLAHWDKFIRSYKFRLQYDGVLTPGQHYVLVAVFSSPYTARIFAQEIFSIDKDTLEIRRTQ